jgi:hypothetical protein
MEVSVSLAGLWDGTKIQIGPKFLAASLLFWAHPRWEKFAEFQPTTSESQNLGLNQTVMLFLMFPFDVVFFTFSMLNKVLNSICSSIAARWPNSQYNV